MSLVLLAALAISSSVSAQSAATRGKPPAASTKDPFIGVSEVERRKSNTSRAARQQGFIRAYEDRGGGTIFMTTDVTVPQGSARAFLVYRRDGKAYPEAAVGADRSAWSR